MRSMLAAIRFWLTMYLRWLTNSPPSHIRGSYIIEATLSREVNASRFTNLQKACLSIDDVRLDAHYSELRIKRMVAQQYMAHRCQSQGDDHW
ncbi:MAG: hypothetical protein Kow0063_41680 [Anaerolineae bacterium]